MKNKLSDLNNHLFAQLERLSDENLTPDQLNHETQRTEAVATVALQIIRNAALQIQAAKIVADTGHDPVPYLPPPNTQPKLPSLRVVSSDRKQQ